MRQQISGWEEFEVVYFERLNFMIGEFYPNKMFIKKKNMAAKRNNTFLERKESVFGE